MRWDADDQGKALAWVVEQRTKCDTCGTFPWMWDDDHPDAYIADGLHCHGCHALEVEADRRKDDPPDPGVRLVLYPKGADDGS